MNRIASRVATIILSSLVFGLVYADTLHLPWAFGMTPDQVRSVTSAAPYKSFSNGDLETYDGLYDGQKENFQFYFKDEKLWRISVTFYEGPDQNAAAKKWASLHNSLEQKFGAIETPDNDFKGTINGKRMFAEKAIKIAIAPGKSQMAPIKQPGDASVFASFQGYDVQGQRMYAVNLYFSKRT